ncbi:MAG: GDSL-type esterase/lipase family protein [Pseudoflavonifractor sp.]
MKKHIVCLGDSNTHGYCGDPADCADSALLRFNEDERWTCRLQAALGSEYLVVEEGLSGRTTVFRDPLYEGLAAIDYLVPCLKSHEPVALLLIMLGTNDTKERFAANAHCIALGMERLVKRAQGVDCWGGKAPNILIVAPPVIDPRMETSVVGHYMGAGSAAKSRALPPLLSATARQTGCHFLNAGSCQFNQSDYMHLTRRGHAQLAEQLAALVPELV